jgi:hypothetical protein
MESEEHLTEPLGGSTKVDVQADADSNANAGDTHEPHADETKPVAIDEEKQSVPVPVVEAKPQVNRLRENVAARDKARDSVKAWNTGVHSYIQKTREILNEVQERVLEQNKVVSSEWKLVRAFYTNYVGSFKAYGQGEGEHEIDPAFSEKITILQARLKKDGKAAKFSEFETMLLNINTGEQTRRAGIVEYKAKFQKEVIQDLEQSLYQHEDIKACMTELKAAATLRKELEGRCESSFASLKAFEKSFMESRDLNNRGKRSAKCSFEGAKRFTTEITELSTKVKEYGHLLIECIEHSKLKHNHTVAALRNSFNKFKDMRTTYFGDRMNPLYDQGGVILNKIGKKIFVPSKKKL